MHELSWLVRKYNLKEFDWQFSQTRHLPTRLEKLRKQKKLGKILENPMREKLNDGKISGRLSSPILSVSLCMSSCYAKCFGCHHHRRCRVKESWHKLDWSISMSSGFLDENDSKLFFAPDRSWLSDCSVLIVLVANWATLAVCVCVLLWLSRLICPIRVKTRKIGSTSWFPHKDFITR